MDFNDFKDISSLEIKAKIETALESSINMSHSEWVQLRSALKAKSMLSNRDLDKIRKEKIKASRRKRQVTALIKRNNSLANIRISNQQLREIVQEAWNALHDYNSSNPVIFRGMGTIIGIDKQDDPAKTRVVSTAELYARLTLIANWYRQGEDRLIPSYPPDAVCKVMQAMPDSSLPPLKQVISSPRVSKNGQIINQGGYHKEDEVYFDGRNRIDFDPVADNPSDEEIESAIDLLDEVIHDFPFENREVGRAHWLAALLSLFCRLYISGPIPLLLVIANNPGLGKTLLVQTIFHILYGKDGGPTSLPTQEDEFKKFILSKLIEVPEIVFFDNADDKKDSGMIHSPSLASVLTSTRWSDRILGSSQIISVLNLALWVITGNNIKASKELTRRSLQVVLATRTDRPWLREGFKHPNLLEWIDQNRSQLVRSCFVLVKAWLSRGMPKGEKRLGSFESFSDVIGGILQVAGINGFLSNMDSFYEQSDIEGQEWREFVDAWFRDFRDADTEFSDLFVLCEKLQLMIETRGKGDERRQRTVLGRALKAHVGRIFQNQEITLVKDSTKKGRSYRLKQVEIAEPDNSSSPSISELDPLLLGYSPQDDFDLELTY